MFMLIEKNRNQAYTKQMFVSSTNPLNESNITTGRVLRAKEVV
jgi:hypothetical protein